MGPRSRFEVGVRLSVVYESVGGKYVFVDGTVAAVEPDSVRFVTDEDEMVTVEKAQMRSVLLSWKPPHDVPRG